VGSFVKFRRWVAGALQIVMMPPYSILEPANCLGTPKTGANAPASSDRLPHPFGRESATTENLAIPSPIDSSASRRSVPVGLMFPAMPPPNGASQHK
jgi:hypothetical protein